MACDRVGYAYTCVEVWPDNLARWCDSCYERFGRPSCVDSNADAAER
jgi:hypothetical protein